MIKIWFYNYRIRIGKFIGITDKQDELPITITMEFFTRIKNNKINNNSHPKNPQITKILILTIFLGIC